MPRRVYPPPNTPAFAGHTTGRAHFAHPASDRFRPASVRRQCAAPRHVDAAHPTPRIPWHTRTGRCRGSAPCNVLAGNAARDHRRTDRPHETANSGTHTLNLTRACAFDSKRTPPSPRIPRLATAAKAMTRATPDGFRVAEYSGVRGVVAECSVNRSWLRTASVEDSLTRAGWQR